MTYQWGRLQLETGLRWHVALRYYAYYRRGHPGYALRLGPIGVTWESRRWV